MSIYQGFHYDLEKQPNKKQVRQQEVRSSIWKRLVLGFGLSICILSVTAALFFYFHL